MDIADWSEFFLKPIKGNQSRFCRGLRAQRVPCAGSPAKQRTISIMGGKKKSKEKKMSLGDFLGGADAQLPTAPRAEYVLPPREEEDERTRVWGKGEVNQTTKTLCSYAHVCIG